MKKNITITRKEKGYAHQVYRVDGAVTTYTDKELLEMCDLNNFGGIVKRYGKTCAIVKVYTD